MARRLDAIVAELRPGRIVSDHISLSATLALRALGARWDSFVPGHPSQLPVGDEVYGAPPYWPAGRLTRRRRTGPGSARPACASPSA